LFAVQGGIFAEGVDFCGNMAEAAIIIGPGLPSFDLERELLREYYERTYGAGFDYAYTYPAMTKVIQSAGRVIRSEQERGLIVLMDQRFISDSYARAMPADWFEQSVKELVSTSILKDIKNFWHAGAEGSVEQQSGLLNV
jgi:DNA excision repair protein ERCC-2